MSNDITVEQLNVRKYTDWVLMKAIVKRAAPPTVVVTKKVLDAVKAALQASQMSGWLFAANGTPIGVALMVIREDGLLGKRELIIYAAANLRKLTTSEWAGCFAKARTRALGLGCTHISFYSAVPRLMEMAAMMGGDTATRYVSIPLGGNND